MKRRSKHSANGFLKTQTKRETWHLTSCFRRANITHPPTHPPTLLMSQQRHAKQRALPRFLPQSPDISLAGGLERSRRLRRDRYARLQQFFRVLLDLPRSKSKLRGSQAMCSRWPRFGCFCHARFTLLSNGGGRGD